MDVPYSLEMLRARASADEQSRLRCLSRRCPLRNKQELAALKPDTPATDAEIPMDDMEGSTIPFEAEGEVSDEETPAGERDYLIDLWPFSRPVRSYSKPMGEV